MSAFDDFAHREIWVRWRSEERGGKPTKVPYSPAGDGRASSTDPSTWGTREEAERGNHGDGLGIILAPLGANRHLGGIDLDGCINDEGDVARWAREIVELVMSYTEVSPSGHGLKIYFEHDPAETLPEPKGWRSNVRIKGQTNGSGKSPGIELYLHDRYFAVTDDTFEQYDTIRVVDLDTLNAVQKRMVAVADKPKAVKDHPQRHDDEQQLILDAIAHIPNPDLHWNDWTRIGMAIFAATEGSAAGHAAFLNFSAKSSMYDRAYSDERWGDWHRSPPDRLTAGTIFHEAKAAGWQDPRRRNGHGSTPPPRDDAEPTGESEPNARGKGNGHANRPIFIRTGDQFRLEYEPLKYAIDDLLVQGQVTAITAPTTAGKTTLALSIGGHKANGLAFAGKDTPKGHVLYALIENVVGTQHQYIAMVENWPGFDESRFHFLTIDGRAGVGEIRERIEQHALALGVALDILIVDTAPALSPTDDENDNVQQGDYARALRTLTMLPGTPPWWRSAIPARAPRTPASACRAAAAPS